MTKLGLMFLGPRWDRADDDQAPHHHCSTPAPTFPVIVLLTDTHCWVLHCLLISIAVSDSLWKSCQPTEKPVQFQSALLGWTQNREEVLMFFFLFFFFNSKPRTKHKSSHYLSSTKAEIPSHLQKDLPTQKIPPAIFLQVLSPSLHLQQQLLCT